MNRVFIDGFESGDISLWDVVSEATAIAARTGHDGSYCANLTGLHSRLEKNLPAAGEYYFCFRIELDSGVSIRKVLTFFKDTTVLLHLRVNSSRYLEAYSGTTSLLATGTKQLVTGTVYRIEVYVKVADSNGRFVVKVDGITDIDYTGDTKPGDDTQINKMVVGTPDANYYSRFYCDNVVVDSSEFPGNTRIQAIKPTGAGQYTQWTASAGDNWACVDETPPSDTDYVYTNSVGQIDSYAASNLSGNIASIKCVQVQARAKYEGTPTPTKLDLTVRTHSSDYTSSDNVVSSSWAGYSYLWQNNPNTSAAWTETEVNDVEIGIKSVA